jgi:hypothetical protein
MYWWSGRGMRLKRWRIQAEASIEHRIKTKKQEQIPLKELYNKKPVSNCQQSQTVMGARCK